MLGRSSEPQDTLPSMLCPGCMLGVLVGTPPHPGYSDCASEAAFRAAGRGSPCERPSLQLPELIAPLGTYEPARIAAPKLDPSPAPQHVRESSPGCQAEQCELGGIEASTPPRRSKASELGTPSPKLSADKLPRPTSPERP
mmetsp:Transcript_34223/g.83119  ORF Transcript_34223/g.83119 Transcript_34223/m.83119 type:complete len:141 (-) Transcript_34223:207-629(-)